MLAAMRSRTKSLFACLLGVALAVPAIAQSGSVTQYPTCPDPPPRLSKAELEAAGASYHVGVEAFDNGDYRKALDNIKDAFKRDCTKVQLLEQLASIYAALGDRPEAIHALETYLQRNPKAGNAETIQNRIQNLKALMAQSAPTTTGSATSSATATVSAVPTVTATATTTTTASVEVRGHTIAPWIVVGAGAAAAIAGGILLGVGQGYITEAHAGCPTPFVAAQCVPLVTPPPNYNENNTTTRSDVQSRGVTLADAGWVIGGVGLAAIIGGIVWHFLEPTGPVEAKASASLTPIVGPGFAGLSFGAKF